MYICNVCTYSKCTFRRPSVWTLKETEHPVFHIGSLQLILTGETAKASQPELRVPLYEVTWGRAQSCLRLQAHLVLSISVGESYRLLIHFRWSACEREADLSPSWRGWTDAHKPFLRGCWPSLAPPCFVPIGVSAAGILKRSRGWMQPEHALDSCVWSGRCERGRLKWEKCFHVRIF